MKHLVCIKCKNDSMFEFHDNNNSYFVCNICSNTMIKALEMNDLEYEMYKRKYKDIEI